MPHIFDDDVLTGVLRHMNDDHADDNVLIARAFGAPGAVSALLAGFDGDGADWIATLSDGSGRAVHVGWPGGPITERAEVRREIIALYDAACERLGVAPRSES
jgi:hypothetical protein